MRMTIAAAALVLAGCQAAQTPAALPPQGQADANAPVERLTWPYRASYEVDMLRAASQDRRIRIAVGCGLRSETWGNRASELIGRGMGRTLGFAQLHADELARLRLIGAAMRAQAHYLAGQELERGGRAICVSFETQRELDQLTGYLTGMDRAFPR